MEADMLYYTDVYKYEYGSIYVAYIHIKKGIQNGRLILTNPNFG